MSLCFPKIWKLSKNLTTFQKFENFPKIWTLFKNLKNFWKIWKLLKIWKFSDNLKLFQKSEIFSKIWKFSENLNNFWKSETFPHHCNQMSQRSHVSRVALYCQKSKGGSVSEWFSQSVTRSPIELSGDS